MQVSVNLKIARHLPAPGASLEQAQGYTRWLAGSHYENFTVASFLLPRGLRQHFCNVYAYCRWADDLGDEVPDPATALRLLDWWEHELRECYAGTATHAVFIALRETIRRFNIPIEPFADLVSAFRQDQTVIRRPDWNSVLEYCRFSANPVGRLVLYLNGYRDEERQRLSDCTCSALQLTNFWQDVSRDLDKNRIYIPLDALAVYGLSEADLFKRHFTGKYAAMMEDLVSRTRQLFQQGLPLVESVAPEVRVPIEMFSRGGLSVLDAIESIGYNTLQQRPALSAATKLWIVARTYAKRYKIGGILRTLSQSRVGRST
jgi:squalene synthase HpnC